VYNSDNDTIIGCFSVSGFPTFSDKVRWFDIVHLPINMSFIQDIQLIQTTSQKLQVIFNLFNLKMS